MKKLALLSGILVFASALTAGVQDHAVTPATLADWQLTGADRAKVQARDTLELPAGAEISRTFPVGMVVLHTVSRPHFGSTPDDWPVVQVGPAALALVRKGVHGELVLLVGEVVSILTAEIPLDAGGRVLQPLEIALGYDPAAKTGVVAFADQVLSFKGTAKDPAGEIAVSAGARYSWAQDALEVLVITPDGPSDAAGGLAGGEPAKRAALLASAVAQLRQAGEVINAGNITTSAVAARPETPPGGSTLEVYTPASVRHGAAAVRAAIAGAKAL